jgi:sugar phosphate isomerase/epimerase
MRIYISSSCSRKRSVFDAVEELAQAGFSHIELSGGNDFDGYSQVALLEMRQKLGLTFLVHNYFPPQPETFVLNMASSDKATRSRCLRLVREALALSAALGQTHYGVHAGYSREMSLSRDQDGVFVGSEAIAAPRLAQEAFIEVILAELPAELCLAVENAFPRPDDPHLSLMATPEDILYFLERFSNPTAGLLLDLGHLGVSAHILQFDKYAFLRNLVSRFGSRILELHLSTHTGNRDTHSITRPDSPDVTFLMKHRMFLEHAPLVLEWQNADCKEAFAAYTKLLPFLSQHEDHYADARADYRHNRHGGIAPCRFSAGEHGLGTLRHVPLAEPS